MHAMTRAIRQLVVLVAVFAVLPATAHAASAFDVLRDCADDGQIQGTYNRATLIEARGSQPGDLAAYGECTAAINAKIASMKKGGGGDGPGGTGKSADLNGDGKVTPAERRAAKKRAKQEKRELASLGGGLTPDDPGGLGGGGGSDDGTSLPLILALIALALAALAGGAWYAARRNPAFANTLRRVPLPGRRG